MFVIAVFNCSSNIELDIAMISLKLSHIKASAVRVEARVTRRHAPTIDFGMANAEIQIRSTKGTESTAKKHQNASVMAKRLKRNTLSQLARAKTAPILPHFCFEPDHYLRFYSLCFFHKSNHLNYVTLISAGTTHDVGAPVVRWCCGLLLYKCC